MGRPERRAARAAARAKRKADKRRASLEAARDREADAARDREREDIFAEVRPIWEAWIASAAGRKQTPLQLHEFVVVWGHSKGWPPRKIEEHIQLTARFVELHMSAKATEARNRKRALEKLSPDQRIMAEALPTPDRLGE